MSSETVLILAFPRSSHSHQPGANDAGASGKRWQRAWGSTAKELSTGVAFVLRAKKPGYHPSCAHTNKLCDLGQITWPRSSQLPHSGATWGLEDCMGRWVERCCVSSGVLAFGVWVSYCDRQF